MLPTVLRLAEVPLGIWAVGAGILPALSRLTGGVGFAHGKTQHRQAVRGEADGSLSVRVFEKIEAFGCQP
jgi:hypothetical protein